MAASKLLGVTDTELTDLPDQCVQVKGGIQAAAMFQMWWEVTMRAIMELKPDIADCENNAPDGKLIQQLFERRVEPEDAALEYVRTKFPNEVPKVNCFICEAPATIQ